MDREIHLQDLKDAVQAFCEARDWDQFHSAKDLAIGLITEASELLEHFRFKSESEIQSSFASAKKREEISNELADTFFFLLRFAQMNQIDLSDSLKRKMARNAEKYPVEKSKGKNTKYTEFES